MIRRLVVVLLAVTVLVGTAACTPAPTGPGVGADAFFAALDGRDIAAAAAATDDPDAASAALQSAFDGLQAESVDAEAGAVAISGDTATVGYTYTWRLPRGREWSYDGQVQMGRRDGRWVVRWNSGTVHPRLGDDQSMVLRSEAAPRARVNERSGSDVLVPGTVHRVRFDAGASRDRVATANALVRLLGPLDPALTAQSIVESATAASSPYPVITLSEGDYQPLATALAALPGVDVSDEADLVPTDPGFAPDLIGQVKKSIIDQVDGQAGWSVVAMNSTGSDVAVLTETAPKPVPSVSISLDRPVQVAAQNAVNARPDQTMMVVIKPSTGDILAVAQNAAADREGPLASTGLYPPGSTFKMITAGAAIATGLATPDTPVPCPGRIVIGERSIPNYNEFALGTVSMTTAFARSCNTSFAKLASELPADALTVSASKFGIGPDYSVVGLPTESGSVPPAEEMVQRTEDGFGQGKVLVSAFGMALAAATVDRGSTPVPRLILGDETTVAGAHPPIDPAMVDGLRAMMRTVVTSGTALRIADQGEVYGKTGEAEVEGGSHAWFVGYRGDLAFATLVVRGGSSDNAVAVTRDMMAALPPGY